MIQNVGNTITQTLYKSGQTGEGGDHYTGLDRFGRIIELLWEDDTAGDDLEYFKYMSSSPKPLPLKLLN